MLIKEYEHDVPTSADGNGTMRMPLPPIQTTFSPTHRRNIRLPPHRPRLPQRALPWRSRLQRDLPGCVAPIPKYERQELKFVGWNV